MQEAGSPTPENGSASFDVKTSDAGGRGRGVLLDGATLGWNSGETRQRRAFDDIASIAFESVIGGDADFARCDFRFADGVDLTVELNNPDTVADIVAYRSFVLRLFEVLGPAQRARIDFRHGYRRSTQMQMMIAGIFGLEGRLATLSRLLSQGEKKLLDVASAFALEPQVILLDEPTSGVSTADKHGIMTTLIAVAKQAGVKGIVLVEHDMDLVAAYSHRIVALSEGRMLADLPPDRFFADPALIAAVVGKPRGH